MGAAAPKPPHAIHPHSKLWDILAFSHEKPAPHKGAGVLSDSFWLTYAAMFDPPPALHQRFEKALTENAQTSVEHAIIIAGEEVQAEDTFEDRSPINQDGLPGRYQKGGCKARLPWRSRPPAGPSPHGPGPLAGTGSAVARGR